VLPYVLPVVAHVVGVSKEGPGEGPYIYITGKCRCPLGSGGEEERPFVN